MFWTIFSWFLANVFAAGLDLAVTAMANWITLHCGFGFLMVVAFFQFTHHQLCGLHRAPLEPISTYVGWTPLVRPSLLTLRTPSYAGTGVWGLSEKRAKDGAENAYHTLMKNGMYSESTQKQHLLGQLCLHNWESGVEVLSAAHRHEFQMVSISYNEHCWDCACWLLWRDYALVLSLLANWLLPLSGLLIAT